MIVTFLPAAGRSSRMGGRDKLLEDAGGEPLLRRAVRRALGAGLGPVRVGLKPGDAARRATLDGLAPGPHFGILEVPDAGEGMAASLRAGAREARALIDAHLNAHIDGAGTGPSGLMIVLPDMPDIETGDLVALAGAFRAGVGPITRATAADGRPGHPVIFPARLLPGFADLTGDRGAAPLLAGEGVVDVALPGTRALTDLDTPDDWARWRETPSSA